MPKKKMKFDASVKTPDSDMNQNKSEDEIVSGEDSVEDDELTTGDESEQEDADVDDGSPPEKKSKLNKAELYKVPTNEELNQLRETENLFQSSLFRLQISEMLVEVSLKEKKKNGIDNFVTKLTSFLMDLKKGPQHDLSDTSWLKKLKVKLPIAMVPPSNKGKFQFCPPKSIKPIGSYPLNVCLKPQPCVDLAVEMPKDCFQPKDYLNQRYLRKRALYLAVLAKRLKSFEEVEELLFTYHHCNTMRPILVLKPKGKGFKVHIHPYPEEGVFKTNRFHLNKNNIRQWWYKQEKHDGVDSEENVKGQPEPPTPHYNMWVVRDLVWDVNEGHAMHQLWGGAGLTDGISLLKVWLHQRELDEGAGCFSNYIMLMYVVYLLSERKLNPLMSSYQVMRNTLLHLSQSDWCNQGISLAGDVQSGDNQPSIADYHNAFDVVFIDRTGYLNLAADVCRATWDRVKHEAKLSIEFLETPGLDSFEVLFMTPVKFIHTFDQYFHISTSDKLLSCAKHLKVDNHLMDHCGDVITVCLPKLIELLHKSLGKRIHLLGIHLKEPSKWSINDCPPIDEQLTLTFGLLLNPDAALSVIEKGPSADTPEAMDFREFWGDKSELRRFQDGSICEAVVWPCATIADRRRIVAKIVKHTLHRHANLSHNDIKFIATPLDSLLKLPIEGSDNPLPYGTGEEQILHVHKCYDELAKKLRKLQDLPLTIHTIQGVSAVFRYAEVFPPLPAAYFTGAKSPSLNFRGPNADRRTPIWIEAIKVLCMLETSGKWPEDKEAIQRVKAAFLLKIRDLLIKQYHLICQITTKHLDIFVDNLVFRLEIGYQKEIALHKLIQTPEGMTKMVKTEAADQLEHNIVTLPSLTGMLHGLQQQHSTFSSTVRLAKRWLSAHFLLDGYITEEAVELIVAHLYLTPAPYKEPGSPLVGFLRFLFLLCHHDWQHNPLIVNLNNKLKREDFTEIHSQFTKNRATLPLMCIASPLDKAGSQITRGLPTVQILQRIMLLANESLAILHKQILLQTELIDFKQVFRPPLDSYDVIIYLKHEHVPRRYQAVDVAEDVFVPPYKSADKIPVQKCFPVTEYDPPINYLRELREAYGELALFFYDIYGGDMITVVWKPASFEPRPFKTSHVSGCHLDGTCSDKELMICPNVEAILEGFKTIGEGLVDRIETRVDRWKI